MIGQYDYPDRVLGRILEDRADRLGDKPFLRFVGVRDLTYREFDEMTNRVANALADLGAAKGDKILVILPNCPEYLSVWFAANKLGAVEVPLNTALRGEGLVHQINACDAKIAVVDHRQLPFLMMIEARLTSLETVIVFEGKGRAETPVALAMRTIPFAGLLDYPADRPAIDAAYTDIAAIMYTSGTTGLSKGVTMCHNYLYETAMECVKYCGYTDQDVLYNGLPFFHANNQLLTVLPTLLAEATAVIAERFTAGSLWRHVREYNATAFNYIGAVLPLLYKQPESADDRNHCVRIALGAAAPANLWTVFEERFGVQLIEVYGLTEFLCVAVNNLPPRRLGSFGRATTGYEVKVFDDRDVEVPAGTVGELVMRPQRPYIGMSGYYRRPEETLAVCRNLWFHSGDFGYRDEDGYFYFVDRKKDCIRRRGENISSFEVEKVLNSCPKVLESAVAPVPSDLGEDEVKVSIVVVPGEALSPEELIAFCEPRLPYFAIPRYVEFRESLPKNASEKVEKYKLKAEGITPGCWDREKAGYQLSRIR